jgi:uncharacterized protein
MTIMRSLSGIIVAVLLSASSAFAGALEDAIAAYDQKDYATALRLFQPLAEKGDATAQVRLGTMYGDGVGVARDAAEALKWLRKAAEQGDAYGQGVLGVSLRGIGGGFPEDDAEAAKWARKAADQGNVPAQFVLGDMYEKGIGVPQDYVLAYMWFNLGAAHGDFGGAEIAHRYGFDFGKPSHVAEFRDKLTAKMTPEQIAEAQRLAREWKPTK